MNFFTQARLYTCFPLPTALTFLIEILSSLECYRLLKFRSSFKSVMLPRLCWSIVSVLLSALFPQKVCSQEALGGNSRTCLICTISPCYSNAPETLSTLRLSQQAKLVTNKAVVNQVRRSLCQCYCDFNSGEIRLSFPYYINGLIVCKTTKSNNNLL